jgi:hypothetical protein
MLSVDQARRDDKGGRHSAGCAQCLIFTHPRGWLNIQNSQKLQNMNSHKSSFFGMLSVDQAHRDDKGGLQQHGERHMQAGT